MVGRVRLKGDGLNTLTLGRWMPNGSYATCTQPRSSLCYDRTNPGPPYKSGGSLYIVHREMNFRPSASVELNNSLWGKYTGSFIPSKWPATWWYGGSLPPTDGYESFLPTADVVGSKGWNRYKPGKPGVSLGQALIELRRIPTIPIAVSKGLVSSGLLNSLPGIARYFRDKHYSYKELGKDYLNAEFGWAPFLRDLRSLIGVQAMLEKRLAQLKRDNGKPVRRGGIVSQESDVDVAESSVFHPMYPSIHPFYHTQAGSSYGRRTLTTSTHEKSWFSAKFRYFIPDLDTDQGQLRSAAKLIGLFPSASLLWEVLPWSWLIDYFVNIGDVINNLSENAAENLVAEYAYVMSEWKLHYVCNESVNILTSSGVRHISCESETIQHVKRRSFASPYGFGFTPQSLSGKQALILSALGISRNW